MDDSKVLMPLVSSDVGEARQSIADFEAYLKTFGEEDQVDCPLEHKFVEGLYLRELFIPKGTVLVGVIRKDAGYDFMVEGDITVLTESGLKRLTGFYSGESKPGLKRVGYAHEDTRWVTVHANPDNETNIEVLESRIIAEDYGEVLLTESEAAMFQKITEDL